ncbi:MAG: hypothetical protein DWQ07_21785 [Chloroflexi bacterium]|nr:MAG: hypothetical protein DWQ07_21785 [Chloroflexota bacterium]MBL1197317.1 hypothetical protein [Chloroflexota bacterium]NOH14613.1 hypothetical protein [Chloroflexota bacterium]
MNALLRSLIALFIIAHGLVHPILSIVPDNEVENAPVGTFWNSSWLLGESTFVKRAIYILSGLSALLFLLAGLSFAGWLLPVVWWRGLWVAGAGLSAFLLVVFWHPWFVIGLVIDALMLAFVLVPGPLPE